MLGRGKGYELLAMAAAVAAAVAVAVAVLPLAFLLHAIYHLAARARVRFGTIRPAQRIDSDRSVS